METLVLGFLKILYIHIIPYTTLEKGKKIDFAHHRMIECLTVFGHAFCHSHIENLLKGPSFLWHHRFSNSYILQKHKNVDILRMKHCFSSNEKFY